MKEKSRFAASVKSDALRTVRCTISFPTEHYAELERIAKSKKVSLAWVVREATEKYLADQWPLFRDQERDRKDVA